jgi:hypothetical protein
VSDVATVGTKMEFIITKDDSDTKDQIVLLSLRRIAVRRPSHVAPHCCCLLGQTRAACSLAHSLGRNTHTARACA